MYPLTLAHSLTSPSILCTATKPMSKASQCASINVGQAKIIVLWVGLEELPCVFVVDQKMNGKDPCMRVMASPEVVVVSGNVAVAVLVTPEPHSEGISCHRVTPYLGGAKAEHVPLIHSPTIGGDLQRRSHCRRSHRSAHLRKGQSLLVPQPLDLTTLSQEDMSIKEALPLVLNRALHIERH